MFAQADFSARFHAEVERRRSAFLRRAFEKNPRTYLRRLRMLASLSAICAAVAALLFVFGLFLLAIHRIPNTGSAARAIVLLLAFALSACANFLWHRWYRDCLHQAARDNIRI